MERWVAATDLHGDQSDPAVVGALERFLRDYKPQHRFFLGDVWDLRPWRAQADEDEKRERVRSDFDAGMGFLERFRPEAICLGNHDVRLWDVADRGGPMADLADGMLREFEKFCQKLKCRVIPYEKRSVLKVGKWKGAHGFFDGDSAAKKMAQAFGSIHFGHGHAFECSPVATHGAVSVGRMIGCLCRKDFKYNRRNISALRQEQGWAYGPLFRNGNYQTFEARVIEGLVTYAEKVKTIKV